MQNHSARKNNLKIEKFCLYKLAAFYYNSTCVWGFSEVGYRATLAV